MTLVASGDIYLVGSSGLGATRSIAYEIDGAYTAPAFFSDMLDNACSNPVAFSGSNFSDFYSHTQGDLLLDPTIDTFTWSTDDLVDVNWTNNASTCLTQTHTYVYKNINLAGWVYVDLIATPTSWAGWSETGSAGDKIQVKLIAHNSTESESGNDVISLADWS